MSKKDYHHLTYEDRCQIYALNKRGISQAKIASQIGVDRSTIFRELRRNSGGKGYRYKQAHYKYLERREKANSKKQKMCGITAAIVEILLISSQWSPEQISGRMGLLCSEHKVSHQTIYRYIRKDKALGGFLYKELRHKGKKYNKRKSKDAGRGCIPDRVDISKRPIIVDKKERIGDWEFDTIIGAKHKGAIVSMVDRASKLVKFIKVSGKNAEEVEKAIIKRLEPIREYIHTCTADNGKEFANHLNISEVLGADFYFATPYCSWERGLNEHTNGLFRQYFPKGTFFEDISDEDVLVVENLLNNRPRKELEFKTPLEVFNEKCIEYNKLVS